MADALVTLADLVLLNDISVADRGATDIFNDAPLLAVLAAEHASHGTDHKYIKETGAPTVGFRAVNTGLDHGKPSDAWVTEALKILDACFDIDCKLADSNPRGADHVMARQARRHLRAAFSMAEFQTINGTGNDSDGFTGLKDNAGLNALEDAMVIDAGGSGTGVFGDVWMFRSTSDLADVAMIMGNDGGIEIQPYMRQQIKDSSGGKYPGYWQQIDGWMGMQIGGSKSVARMANFDLSDNASSNTVTDDALSEMFEAFPEEKPPTHIAMNKRGRKQLQQSRTATNATGAPAPWPTHWENIPIVSTRACTSYTTALA